MTIERKLSGAWPRLLLGRLPKRGNGTSRSIAPILLILTVFLLAISFFENTTIWTHLDDYQLSFSAHKKATRKLTVGNGNKVRVFYNLFTKSSEDEERVIKIVEEQFALVDPNLHELDVSITSLGHRLPLADASLGNASYHIDQHYEKGDEYLTLRSIWKYCQSDLNRDAKVVYLHSKGSFHPKDANDKLRKFLTHGALSSECANLPASCNVCSSRMSPLPHPHTSGNMWLARCDYISQLIDPSVEKLPKIMQEDDSCTGRGRYFAEHWVHSHPAVKPCDLYTGEYVWNYIGVPDVPFEKDLQMAPRFEFQQYDLGRYDIGQCGSKKLKDFVNSRMENYELLYNVTSLPEEWWGWDLLERSIGREER